MYVLMTGYWPTAESDPAATPAMVEFARIRRAKAKIVVSPTLESVSFNGRLIREGALDEVARLKAEPGFDLDFSGPTTVARRT